MKLGYEARVEFQFPRGEDCVRAEGTDDPCDCITCRVTDIVLYERGLVLADAADVLSTSRKPTRAQRTLRRLADDVWKGLS